MEPGAEGPALAHGRSLQVCLSRPRRPGAARRVRPDGNRAVQEPEASLRYSRLRLQSYRQRSALAKTQGRPAEIAQLGNVALPVVFSAPTHSQTPETARARAVIHKGRVFHSECTACFAKTRIKRRRNVSRERFAGQNPSTNSRMASVDQVDFYCQGYGPLNLVPNFSIYLRRALIVPSPFTKEVLSYQSLSMASCTIAIKPQRLSGNWHHK